MNKIALSVLRVGLGVTFVWIAYHISLAPAGWGATIRPWAANLLPLPIVTMMLATAALDAAVGILLILNLFTWGAALVGAIHILIVLVTVGITDITQRDIGLLAASLALTIETLPPQLRAKLRL